MDSSSNTTDYELIGISVTIRPVKAATADADTPATDGGDRVPSPISEFGNIGRRFTTVMQSIWEYLHAVERLAGGTSFNNFIGLTILSLRLKKEHSQRADGESAIAELVWNIKLRLPSGKTERRTLTVPIHSHEDRQLVGGFLRDQDSAMRMLNESCIQQVVNCFETLMAEALRCHLLIKPEKIEQEYKIPYRSVLEFGNIEDAQRFVIDQVLNDFIRQKSINEQVKYFASELKVDLASNFPATKELYEVFLRRHAIVHAAGVATADYMRRARAIAKEHIPEVQEGERLPITSSYVRRAWTLAYAAGTILLHLLWVAGARAEKNKMEEGNAAGGMINASFLAIKNEQYDAAKYVLDYAIRLSLPDDAHKWMVIINRAQTHKWTGDKEEADKLLNSSQWTNCNLLFQICVAALRDDMPTFQSMLPDVAEKGDLKLEDLLEWPVFRNVRKHKEFPALIQDAYKAQAARLGEMLQSKVLDPDPKKTQEALFALLQSETDVIGDNTKGATAS